MHVIGLCPSLDHPDNGMVTCSLGPDGLPTEGDTCVYQCDDGYIVSGSGDRTCQSDGTWTGSEPTCTRCKKASVPTITVYIYAFILQCMQMNYHITRNMDKIIVGCH